MNAPPILLKSDFLPDPLELFVRLRDTIAWDERMLARKTASFGVPYDYSQIAYPQADMPPELECVCERIETELRFKPNNCLLNFNPDANASMGFHSDSAEELAPGTGVAIVSLGAVRPIVFRSKADRAVEFSYPLPSGSLLYVTQEMQLDWLHAICKATGSGERISLTFRYIMEVRRPAATSGTS
jgi:alkylated DNA repair dioxygenase AlkB